MTEPKVRFFFVGMGKCGSSWIYEFLRRRDVIATPSIKEPYLIDQPPGKRAKMVRGFYDRHDVMGDFSNLYCWDPDNPAKIHAYNPEARIVVTTRLPSARIRSHFGFLRRNDMVSEETVTDYLDGGDSVEIVERSRYRPIIDRYVAVFGAENVLVLPLEQLEADPQAYADRLLDFIGAERIVLTDEDRAPVLKAAVPRNRLMARAAKRAATALRGAGMLSLLGALKRAAPIRAMLFRPAPPAERVDFGDHAARIEALDRDYPTLLREHGAAV